MKRISLFLLALLGFVGVTLLAILSFRVPTLPFERLNWKSASRSLITLQNVYREGKKGSLTLRMIDGKEQFLPGDWSVFYNSSLSIYLYSDAPNFANSTSTSPHLYNFMEASNIYDISLAHVPGSIVDLKENTKGTYLLIGTASGTQTEYCLMEHLANPVPPCPKIELSNIENAKWNSFEDHELVFKNASGSLFTVDPWEKEEGAPRAVPSDVDPKRLEQLSSLFHEDVMVNRSLAPGNTQKILKTLFNLALVFDAKGWSLYRLPFGSTVTWLFDDTHFLVRELNRFSVYDLKSRTLYPLIEEQGIGNTEVTDSVVAKN